MENWVSKGVNMSCRCIFLSFLSDFSPDQWDLVCDRKHLKAMTQSVYMAGLLLGSVAFSTLSDHFGRKNGVFLSILVMVSIMASTIFVHFICKRIFFYSILLIRGPGETEGWERLSYKIVGSAGLSEILKGTPKRNQNPVLWVWPTLMFTLERY